MASRRRTRRDLVRSLVERSLVEYVEDGCPQFAAAISYHVLFSLFPLAIVIAGVFSLIAGGNGVLADLVGTIVHQLPLSAQGQEQFRGVLTTATHARSALGLVGIVGLVWAATGVMTAIRVALNRAWDARSQRPYLLGKALDVALVSLVLALALASLGCTLAVRVLAHHLPSAVTGADWLRFALGLVVPFALAFGGALFVFRVVPQTRTRLGDLWVGALPTAVGFVVLQNLFALYLGHFGHYAVVYGSLGAIAAFLLFVYLSASLLLLGAELASEWPRLPREEDPDAGPGPPLRERLVDLLRGLVVAEQDAESGTEPRERRER